MLSRVFKRLEALQGVGRSRRALNNFELETHLGHELWDELVEWLDSLPLSNPQPVDQLELRVISFFSKRTLLGPPLHPHEVGRIYGQVIKRERVREQIERLRASSTTSFHLRDLKKSLGDLGRRRVAVSTAKVMWSTFNESSALDPFGDIHPLTRAQVVCRLGLPKGKYQLILLKYALDPPRKVCKPTVADGSSGGSKLNFRFVPARATPYGYTMPNEDCLVKDVPGKPEVVHEPIGWHEVLDTQSLR